MKWMQTVITARSHIAQRRFQAFRREQYAVIAGSGSDEATQGLLPVALDCFAFGSH
jgi:hypothetical protein